MEIYDYGISEPYRRSPRDRVHDQDIIIME